MNQKEEVGAIDNTAQRVGGWATWSTCEITLRLFDNWNPLNRVAWWTATPVVKVRIKQGDVSVPSGHGNTPQEALADLMVKLEARL